MSGISRRGFLRASAALPVIALPACEATSGAPAASASPDPALLRALAEAVLPTELGEAGTAATVAGFARWLAGYQPVAERDHGYGTGEITYTAPDPGPGWAAQLRALDLESRQRFGTGFAELELDRRRELVRASLARERATALPEPADAHTVALGLLAWFYASPAANDLCFRASIGRLTCRPLADSPEQPPPLAPGA
jgi:hypothetical protein